MYGVLPLRWSVLYCYRFEIWHLFSHTNIHVTRKAITHGNMASSRQTFVWIIASPNFCGTISSAWSKSQLIQNSIVETAWNLSQSSIGQLKYCDKNIQDFNVLNCLLRREILRLIDTSSLLQNILFTLFRAVLQCRVIPWQNQRVYMYRMLKEEKI